MGLTPVKQRYQYQITSMDSNLRRGLWNDFHWGVSDYTNYGLFREFLFAMWTGFFKKLTDDPYPKDYFPKYIKDAFFKMKWYRVYDFLEFFTHNFAHEYVVNERVQKFNITLEKEMSAYRFIGKTLVQITSGEEIAEITKALGISKTYTPHLEQALHLLAVRQSPDYANSIKESISAVEATCKLITGDSKATLGQGLDRLGKILPDFHSSQKEAFQKLYGYTSDAEGIRHGLVGKPNLDVEDARFMFIACSAFINYLLAKADKAGLDLSQK